ncbi:uncharacterized protein LOC134720927 [Mytilus trossulus]|uniref:uncharacterized protein LOC134720927 n=1 Tax=Mytilus trossulus TaxID=6551 RepID=UPI00300676F3
MELSIFLVSVISCILTSKWVDAVIFPYNPYTLQRQSLGRPANMPVGGNRQMRPPVNTVQEKVVCPSYKIYYEGDKLVLVLQAGKCELIVEKYAIEDSISMGGKTSEKEKTYVPVLHFKNILPICRQLPYEYKGFHVTVKTTTNCQLTFAVKHFREMNPFSTRPKLISRPVVVNT